MLLSFHKTIRVRDGIETFIVDERYKRTRLLLGIIMIIGRTGLKMTVPISLATESNAY